MLPRYQQVIVIVLLVGSVALSISLDIDEPTAPGIVLSALVVVSVACTLWFMLREGRNGGDDS